MNVSHFISKRLRQGTLDNFSSIVHKIAVASIAIGLAAAIVSFLVMHGFQSAVKKKIYGFSNHLLITKFTMNNAVEEQPFDHSIPLYAQPEQFPFVKSVFKGVGRGSNNFAVNGTYFNENIIEGRFIHFSDSGYSKEVLVSKVIANKIDAKVGDDVILHFFQNPPRFRRLKIVGLYETNLSDYFDGKVLIGDIRMVQQLNGWKSNEAGGLEIALDLNYFNAFDLWEKSLPIPFLKETQIDTVSAQELPTGSLPPFEFDRAAVDEAANAIGESMDYDLNLESVRDKYIQVFEWLDLVKRQVKILLGVILTVICVNMISVILILVMERIPMVGILKAVGASNRTIRMVFIYNGMNLISKGLLWGNVIGISICWLQDQYKIIKLNPHDYYVSYVPIEWSFASIAVLNLLIFATVTLVLLLPTRFITKISPVKAIRFD